MQTTPEARPISVEAYEQARQEETLRRWRATGEVWLAPHVLARWEETQRSLGTFSGPRHVIGPVEMDEDEVIEPWE